MVQKNLPLINSAHGSETRNIINELIRTFNRMGYTYEEALKKAEEIHAENISTQKQIDNLILRTGESDAEVINARGEHSILRERFEVTENSLGLINDVFGSGLIDVNKIHSDFPLDIPFNVWLNRDGTFGNDFDKEAYKAGATQFYFDWENGNNANDGLTPETAIRTFSNLIDVVNAHPSNRININIMNLHMARNFHGYPADGVYHISAGKTVIISPYNRDKIYFSGFERNDLLNWVKDGNAYKASRTTVKEVFDLSRTGYRGLPNKLKKVTSAASVRNERGTFYTDGTDVWIRLIDDRLPDESLGVLLGIDGKTFSLGSDSKLMFDNVGFYLQSSSLGSTNALRVEGGASTELFLINPEFGYAALNGLSTYDVDKVWVFNPIAYDNYKDGLNYHGSSTNKIFEFMGEQWGNGKDEAGNNNGSTGHSGMSIVRFGTLAYSNDGPQIADVGDCYSIMFNCEGHTSTKLTKSNTKAGIFIGGENPKAYLYNCAGGGLNTFSLSAGSDLTKINVRNFKGSDLHPFVKDNLTKV